MKQTIFFLLGVIAYIGISNNLFAQSCPNAYIYDSTNHVSCSGDTIQLTCSMTSIRLFPKSYAPGASNSYTYESIPFDSVPCPFTVGTTTGPNANTIDYILPQDDVWGEVMNMNFGQPINDPNYKTFKFSFYGQNSLQQCVIGSNGVLSWNSSVASPVGSITGTPPTGSTHYCTYSAGIHLPSTNSEFLNCIFAPYHDIDFRALNNLGRLYFGILGSYPCRKLVLSFYNVPLFGNNSQHATSMLVLYETTNTMEFYLDSKTCCSTTNQGHATLGIQNQTGTQATVITNATGTTYNDTIWTATHEAWRIRPVGNLDVATEWYTHTLIDTTLVPVTFGVGEDYSCIASPSNEPKWYVMKTTVIRLDGEELYYEDSVLIKPLDMPQFVITHNGHTSEFDTICKGTNINISLAGGDNYRLLDPSQIEITDPSNFVLNPLTDTTYTFQVDNYTNGIRTCQRKGSFHVHLYSFQVDLGDNKTICRNDTLTLMDTMRQAVGTYFWSYDKTNLLSDQEILHCTPQSTSFVYLTMTDSNFHCQATDSMKVTVNDAPDVYITGDTVICSGTSTTLTAHSSIEGCTFEWISGGTSSTTTVRPSEAQTEYSVSVKLPPAMCETIAKIKVTALDRPIVRVNEDAHICYSDTTEIKVTGNASSYTWATIPEDNSIANINATQMFVSPAVSTMYIANGQNDIGCKNADTMYVYVSALPKATMTFNPSVIDDLDPTILFTDATDGSTVRQWRLSDGDTSSEKSFIHTFAPTDTTQSYIAALYVQNAAGCKDSIKNVLRISTTHYIWAPNAIYLYSNDKRIAQFRVYVDAPIDFELKIYNRWGKCIFSTNKQEQYWDCKQDGKYVPEGSYVWVAKFRHRDKANKVITEKGTISIYK
jgi:hypothetical protein